MYPSKPALHRSLRLFTSLLTAVVCSIAPLATAAEGTGKTAAEAKKTTQSIGTNAPGTSSKTGSGTAGTSTGVGTAADPDRGAVTGTSTHADPNPGASVMKKTTADSPNETTLNDAQIAHVLTVANQVEVEAGKLAAQKAETAEVKTYAQQMVGTHSNAVERTAKLAKTLKLKPQANPLSKSLQMEADAAIARMRKMEGKAFDREYIGSQISMHGTVLRTIEQELLPQARDPQLRAMLEQLRPTINNHLTHARRMSGTPSSSDNRQGGGITTEIDGTY